MEKKDVLLIGLNPPCPRCDLIKQRVENIIKEESGISINFKKIPYNGEDALNFAASIGKDIGTPKDVEKKANVTVDWDNFEKIKLNPPTRPEDIDKIEGTARMWSPELDEILKPCQEMAERIGMVITPIVIVGGSIKSSGRVPSNDEIKSWLF